MLEQSTTKKTFEYSRNKVLVTYSVSVTLLLTVFILYNAGSVRLSITSEVASLQSFPVSSRLTTPGRTPQSWRVVQILPSTPAHSTIKSSSCGNFVIFSNVFTDGRGLGNQMFNLAAGLLIAKLTQRRIAVNNSVINEFYLEDLFDYNYERFNETCDIYTTGDKHNLAYNPELEMLEASRTTNFANKTIVISGFFQSWKYTINEELLRGEYLRIKSTYKNAVSVYFAGVLPRGWRPDTFTRVAIHVRRGDVLSDHNVKFGYTTPSSGYFKKAMLYMMSLYRRVQFVVVSNDKEWVGSNLTPSLFLDVNTTSFTFDIVHSSYKDKNVDFAILASCHHTIMSTGTFGWWAAWLNRGTTVYYKDWPRKGSPLEAKFKREDFFPPNWIGMSD